MNRVPNQALILIPLGLLALVAIAGQSHKEPPRKLTPTEIAERDRKQEERDKEMLKKQWENHKIELKVMEEQKKKSKYIVKEGGHQYPSDTDETTSWFKAGRKDGVEGLSDTEGPHLNPNRAPKP